MQRNIQVKIYNAMIDNLQRTLKMDKAHPKQSALN
jgi:hypothetical protein